MSSQWSACQVAASFSAPIGGVIFSLELMLPQTYDAFAYWGCFTASVVGTSAEFHVGWCWVEDVSGWWDKFTIRNVSSVRSIMDGGQQLKNWHRTSWGSICYAVERSITTGASGLLPLISSNVLPGEGIDTDYPASRQGWNPGKWENEFGVWMNLVCRL